MTAPSPNTPQIDSTPADVFVSYSSADRDRVKPLVRQLESAGWKVWWDRKLLPGSPFQQEIEQALELAGCVIVVWSKNSVASDWVIAEADEGRKRQSLIPVSLDGVTPPLQFRTRHTVDLSNWHGGVTPEVVEILRALEALLGSPPHPPPVEFNAVVPVTAPAGAPAVAPHGPPEQRLRWSAFVQLLAHAAAAIAVFIDYESPMITGPILSVAGIATTFFAAQARQVAWRLPALCIGIAAVVLGIVNFYFSAKHGSDSFERMAFTLVIGTAISWGFMLPGLMQKRSGGA
jgi:hypothetical protein